MTPLPRTDVLIIDDDAIRGVVAAALTRLGISWDAAVDGADALDRIERTRYAVILVDLMMPRIDGERFVVALRDHERSVRERPVVLMMTTSPVRERLSRLGEDVQAVIRKPLDALELAAIVRACVAGRRVLEEQLPASAVPAAPTATDSAGARDRSRDLRRPGEH